MLSITKRLDVSVLVRHVVSNYSTQALGVQVDDMALLLMQGSQGRGIICDGVVVKGPYVNDRWDPEERVSARRITST